MAPKLPQIHSKLLKLWFLISPYSSQAIKPAHIIVFIALFSECEKIHHHPPTSL